MNNQCSCSHKCTCQDVWMCILKPIGAVLLFLAVVSALGPLFELVMCGTIALCFVAMVGITIHAFVTDSPSTL